MEVLNFTEFRNNLKSSLDNVCDNEDILIVSRGKNKNVVIISLNEYNSLKETRHLLSTENNRKRLQESINVLERR